MSISAMKTRNVIMTLLLSAAGVVASPCVSFSQNAYTAACTRISNQATVSYQVSGSSQNIATSSNVNSFYVGAKVNMTVSTNDSAPVPAAAGTTGQLTTFTITNQGNLPQVYDLTAVALSAGTPLTVPTATTTGVVVSATTPSTTGGYGGSTAKTGVVNPDQSVTVQVASSIPGGATNQQVAGVALLARATFYDDTAMTQGGNQTVKVNGSTSCSAAVIYADGGNGLLGGSDQTRDGAGSSTDAYQVSSQGPSSSSTPTTSMSAGIYSTTTLSYPYPVALGKGEWGYTPGSYHQVSVTMMNASADTYSSVTVTTAVAANAKFCIDPSVGGNGITFIDGNPQSGLSLGSVSFSKDGGNTYPYNATNLASPCDGSVTNIKIALTGTFAASASFKLNFIGFILPGTPAGTTLAYSAVGTAKDNISGQFGSSQTSTTIRVAQLVDVSTAWLDASPVPVTQGQTNAVLKFSVSNQGNGPDSFTLSAKASGSAAPAPRIGAGAIQAAGVVTSATFTPSVTALYLDTNNNGVYDGGDTLYAPGTNDPKLAAGAAVTVFVLASIPSSGLANSAVGYVQLSATSKTGTSAYPGHVIPGAGSGGLDAVIGNSLGVQAATGAYTAAAAGVTVNKSAAVIDQYGGTEVISGATIRYTLTVTASGTSAANNVVITDPMPANTSYTPGSLKLNGATLTDAADGDAGDVGGTTANTVTVKLGNLSSASPAQTIMFDVKIN